MNKVIKYKDRVLSEYSKEELIVVIEALIKENNKIKKLLYKNSVNIIDRIRERKIEYILCNL